MEGPALNPAEQRLAAAVKAGDELDLSRCPDGERTLRASVLRDILCDQAVAERGAGIRLRGAIIEGDLDLRQVTTPMTVDLTNCQATRICLYGANLPRLALRTDAGGSRWLREARALRGAVRREPALVTALLFGFVVLKVIWIARGDVPTALGVFNSAGLATVIAGGLLSALPLVSAVVLGLVTFELSRNRPPVLRFPRDTPVVAIGLAAAVACFFVTPWPVTVSGIGLGLVSGAAARIVPRARKSLRLAGLAVLLALSFVLVLNPLLYAVWLPHETLTLAEPGQQPMVGYVLSDSDGWISLLLTRERRIYRFRSQDVTARTLCRVRSFSMPGAPRWFNSSSPLWNIVVPEEDTALPPCP